MDILRKRKRFDIIDYMPYILGIVAVILIIVLICICVSGDIKSVKDNTLMKLPFKAGSIYQPFGTGAVYIDGEKNELYYVDDRNEIMWGFSGTVEGMQIYTGKGKVAIAVGKKLQVIDEKGTLVFTREFSKNIDSVAVGEKLIAVTISNSDDTIILNGTGEEIDRIVSNVNSTNIRFGVYNNNSVWVITVENSGYSPHYVLSTYKYDSGKTQTVTFSEDSQMIYDAVFYNNLCYIFGTEKIMVRDCDYTGTVSADYNVNGYDVIACGETHKSVSMLLMNNGRLKAIGEKGVMNIECEEKINSAAVNNSYFYGFSQYYMYKIKVKNGKTEKFRFPVRVDNVLQGQGYVLIESGESVYRYSLED